MKRLIYSLRHKLIKEVKVVFAVKLPTYKITIPHFTSALVSYGLYNITFAIYLDLEIEIHSALWPLMLDTTLRNKHEILMCMILTFQILNELPKSK